MDHEKNHSFSCHAMNQLRAATSKDEKMVKSWMKNAMSDH
jgi:hypothetical protein